MAWHEGDKMIEIIDFLCLSELKVLVRYLLQEDSIFSPDLLERPVKKNKKNSKKYTVYNVYRTCILYIT